MTTITLNNRELTFLPNGTKPPKGYRKLTTTTTITKSIAKGIVDRLFVDIDKAIRWLREVKGVHVAVLPAHEKWYYMVYYGYNTLSATGYPSHDLAQSAGLDAAIEYVKKEKHD